MDTDKKIKLKNFRKDFPRYFNLFYVYNLANRDSVIRTYKYIESENSKYLEETLNKIKLQLNSKHREKELPKELDLAIPKTHFDIQKNVPVSHIKRMVDTRIGRDDY